MIMILIMIIIVIIIIIIIIITIMVLVQTVRVCTQDLGMKFGIKKCATLVLKRGKISCSEVINLGNNEIIGEVGTDGYKYLGIAEKDGICHEQVK